MSKVFNSYRELLADALSPKLPKRNADIVVVTDSQFQPSEASLRRADEVRRRVRRESLTLDRPRLSIARRDSDSPSPLENLSGPGRPLQKEPPDAKEFAGLGPEVWRVLDKCHSVRNLGEYEGDLNVDERLVADLIAACRCVIVKLDLLAPIPVRSDLDEQQERP